MNINKLTLLLSLALCDYVNINDNVIIELFKNIQYVLVSSPSEQICISQNYSDHIETTDRKFF